MSLTKQPKGHVNHDTAATRHLCAGTYLDRAFRRKVLEQVYNDPHHRVAPSYGFDLVPVVRHAWRSWLLESLQQAVTCLVLTIGWFCLGGHVIVVLLCWLGLFYFARAGAAALPDALRLKRLELIGWLLRRSARDISEIKDEQRLQDQLWMLRLHSALCLITLVVATVSAGWTGRPPSAAISAAFILLLPIALAIVAAATLRQISLNQIARAPVLRSGRLSRRQKIINYQQSHTVVVFQRPDPKAEMEDWEDFDPFDRERTIFVGSGQLVHRWLPPLVIQLLRPGSESMREREYTRPPFRTDELVDHLRVAMRRVADREDPRRIRLTVCDRVFIEELDVSAECDLLYGAPGVARLRQIIDDSHHAAHQFLEMQVTTDGELVTTVFLRAAVRGRSLSLDFAACALTRTPADYHVIDHYGETGAGAVVRAALRALWRLPEEVGQVVRLIRAPLTLAGAALARKDRTLVPRRRLPVGSRISIREDKSLPWKESRFDEIRIHDDIKLVELRLLKATEEFLDGRKVDTTAFKRMASNIINNSGVLNMGGRLEMKNSAVGSGSRVQVQMQAQTGASQQGGV
ncbi:hypothetical protein [Actinomadura terrae]|uniref:hypothetical protein n=1 Tax=Actinomadura terrae TaxID=604353 RepID=UPI001FA7BDF4|nr:hypothetical protein [Actinomadura terrae]